MLWRRREPLLRTNHMRDTHQMVVDDVGEMVCRIAVGLEQHLVVDLLVVEGDRLTKRVVHDGCTTFLDLETYHTGLSLSGSGLCRAQMAAVPIVAQHLFLLALLLAHGFQTLRGAPTAVGCTGSNELLGITLI